MQRFNMTQVSSETGIPEVVGEGCQMSDGSLEVHWTGGGYKGTSAFLNVTNLNAMYPTLTMVMIDQA